jgi:hypothetical protein
MLVAFGGDAGGLGGAVDVERQPGLALDSGSQEGERWR